MLAKFLTFLIPIILVSAEYGVDVTFPIHNYIKTDSHYKRRYEKSMQGCYKQSSQRLCDATERARLEMNRNQPKTQHNYTELGFKKMRVPKIVWDPLLAFYETNKNNFKPEAWPPGNTYVNNWESPTYMISFEDSSLRGGQSLKQLIWDNIRPVIEEWTGKKLKETSLYGIRIYRDKAVLATHVDRLPLVSSCIIQVAQDINEPWPIEVYSHAGVAYNFTMQPGDMTLYESHTVLHGRPFPLNGSLYANVFVHYIPIDHDDVNEKDEEERKLAAENAKLNAKKAGFMGSITGLFKGHKGSSQSVNKNIGGHEQDNHEDASIEKHLSDIDNGHNAEELRDGQTPLHVAAAIGDIDEVRRLLTDGDIDHSDLLHARDINDWQAIHEAARSGHLEVVEFLVAMGADVTAKTDRGGTPLWWAKKMKVKQEVIDFLENIGAPNEGENNLVI